PRSGRRGRHRTGYGHSSSGLLRVFGGLMPCAFAEAAGHTDRLVCNETVIGLPGGLSGRKTTPIFSIPTSLLLGADLRDPIGTRTTIMNVAEALVYEQGFSATSIDAVIQKAGVTKGAFFHHFKSKAALGLALVERFAERDEKILNRFLARVE